MKSIKDIDVNGKKVLLRTDYNVKIENDSVVDGTRIEASLKTINYLIENNAKVIILSHLGRINSQEDKETNSLEPVCKYLSTLVNTPVYFVPFTRGEIIEKTIENMNNGEILVLENTRFEDYPKKLESSCDESLSKYWASLGDIFVFDAFASAHRCHASTYGISKFLPSYAGFLMETEIEMLDKVMSLDKVLLLGGSKVDDKLGVIENLVGTSDIILLGGAMCFTFLKAKGINVGSSIVNNDKLDYCASLLEKYSDKIYLPEDVVTQNGIKDINNIDENDIGYDLGPKTIESYCKILKRSNVVLWNGPLGMYEDTKYENGTKEIMEFLKDKKPTDTVIAGGDIISATKKFNIDFKYISTGGGATLEYLEGKKFKTLERLNGETK